MTNEHKVVTTEIGMIHIYLKPSDRTARRARAFWPGKQLYRQLVAEAKHDGIINGVAHHAHYGYSSHGPVRENSAEISDPHLIICVELIGQRGELERFCARHGGLLASKVIVYKHLEQWSIGPSVPTHEGAEPTDRA